MARQLFRKAALDKLSSPEQLDKSITIISPTFWLVVLGGGFIIAVALIWSILGRLPINVTVNGVYMGTAGIGGVASEGTGIVDEVYVREGDYVTKGQKLLHLDTAALEEEIESLKERRENVSNVSFDSENDTLTADNKSLIDIKAQRILADTNLTTNKAVLEAKKKELDDQTEKTESARIEYEKARDAYLESMGAMNTSGDQLALQDAQSALSEAKSKLSAAESAYKAALNSENQYARQKDTLEQTIDEASERLSEIESAMQEALEAMNAAQQEQMAAQTQLDAALLTRQMAEEAVNSAQNESEKTQALEHLEEAEAAAAAAEEAYAYAVETYNSNLMMYEAASNSASSLQKDINSYVSNLNSAEYQYELAHDATDSALADLENYGNWVDSAQNDYYTAEYNYIQALGDQSSKQADNSKSGTVYSAAYQEYNTMLSMQRSLETTVLQMTAQVQAEQMTLDEQNRALKMQFDSTRASVLQQLGQEIEEREKNAKSAAITANRDGYLASFNVAVGSAVQAGSVVCRISTDQDNVQAVVCYVPVGEGRKIKKDMKVIVYPSTVNRQEYGHMEGAVMEVSDFLSSSEEMLNLLGDSAMVQTFQQSGPVVKVVCSLRKDDSTVSGYKWSSKKGAGVDISDGTIVSADIVTEEKAPISMLIPYLKEKFTMRQVSDQ